jgi:hypothetical protein
MKDANFFITSKYRGEMLPYERYKLYSYVINFKPKYVLETGCGDGGGSTYYIASAMAENNNGSELYTCDPSRGPNSEMRSEFSSILKYYQTTSGVLISDMLNNGIIPDFIFFDGPEIPQVAVDDINLLEDSLKVGTILSMHDWHTDSSRGYDNAKSIKAQLIKPYLYGSDKWELIEELSGVAKNQKDDGIFFPPNGDHFGEGGMNYDSVGLVFFKKIK